MARAGQLERTSAERTTFDHWMRTGRLPIEPKFNPNHDPADDRFTSGARGGHDIGALSAKYEVGGRSDPGKVSSGVDERGSVSYGSYRLSTIMGTVAEFVAGPKARRRTVAFHGLKPGTAAFAHAGESVVSAEPEAFQAAQKAFAQRSLFDHAARIVHANTGYDAAQGSEATKEEWSGTLAATEFSSCIGDELDHRILQLERYRARRGGSTSSLANDPKHDYVTFRNGKMILIGND